VRTDPFGVMGHDDVPALANSQNLAPHTYVHYLDVISLKEISLGSKSLETLTEKYL
jgi:hypothetical protein